jgi:hypothetical protein
VSLRRRSEKIDTPPLRKFLGDWMYYMCKAPPQVPKSYITMENPTIVTLVRNSLVLVMEEVHHRGGFPNDLKESKWQLM